MVAVFFWLSAHPKANLGMTCASNNVTKATFICSAISLMCGCSKVRGSGGNTRYDTGNTTKPVTHHPEIGRHCSELLVEKTEALVQREWAVPVQS
jgi:hypothetical protein